MTVREPSAGDISEIAASFGMKLSRRTPIRSSA